MNDVGNCDVIFLDILLSNICQFDWLKTLYFQAKFGKERVRANKVIMNQLKFRHFMINLGVGFAPARLL